MLELKDIKKTYLQNSDNEVHALRGVSVSFRECEFVSILGQSGCGKTTLLNLIGGLDRATEGDIVIDGVSTKTYTSSDWDTYRNEKIGFVFQNYNLIPHLNILANVELSLTISGVGAAERQERARKALESVGLGEQLKKLPSQISGGQAQRVAIARAIVNDPAILLADEPTGAIDSETSSQIMDLLKSISCDRLVIMVTHNIELAEKYSTRIIKVLDGSVIEDTDPYYPANDNSEQSDIVETSEAEIKAKEPSKSCTEEEDGGVQIAKNAVEQTNIEDKPQVKSKEQGSAVSEKAGEKKQAKAAMPFFTAVKLSVRNLINKLARSFITAIAGSIGIICIALILAVNNGFSVYIGQFEKQSMSKYPITVSVSNEAGMAALYAFLVSSSSGLDDIDITSIFDIVGGENDNDKYPDTDIVSIYSQLGAMLNNFLSGQSKQKDISDFKRYVEANFDSKYADVKFDYGLALNIFAADKQANGQTTYTQISPLSESQFIATIMDSVMSGSGGGQQYDQMTDAIHTALEQFAFWDELIGDDETITTQYDILAGHLPQNMNEVVLVVNDYNQMSDFYALALDELNLGQFIAAASNPSTLSQHDKTFDQLLDSEEYTYYVLPTSAAYEYNAMTGRYDNLKDTAANPLNALKLQSAITDKAIPVHIAGILRAKPGMSGCVNGVIGYPSSLGKYIIEDANASDYVKAQQAEYQIYADAIATVLEIQQKLANMSSEELGHEPSVSDLSPEDRARWAAALAHATYILDVVSGEQLSMEKYVSLLAAANMRDLDQPQRIYFYANSVSYKDDISEFINDYNYRTQEEEYERELAGERLTTTHVVEFSDELDATVTELHSTVTLITYILVGIALVSVIVTMFLIAIIMSISVQDRTREIGILRAMGARKLDIANIFNVETAILGLLAGIFGVLIAFVLQYPGNILCSELLGIGSVLKMTWWHPLVLIVGSIALTVIAGFIPAISAARKDPVIALRSE